MNTTSETFLNISSVVLHSQIEILNDMRINKLSKTYVTGLQFVCFKHSSPNQIVVLQLAILQRNGHICQVQPLPFLIGAVGFTQVALL